MVLNGVQMILGYKFTEQEIRGLFESCNKSDNDDDFCEYDFMDRINKKLKKKYNNIQAYKLPCCAYTECTDWIIGIYLCYLDGFDMEPIDTVYIKNILKYKKNVPQLKKFYDKLDTGYDTGEPEFFTIANDCQSCT